MGNGLPAVVASACDAKPCCYSRTDRCACTAPYRPHRTALTVPLHRTRTAVPVPQVYLIMELLKGGELLDAVIETGHYGEGEARAIFQQIISAVKYLHSV